MQNPTTIPRTYKERLFASEDPSRVPPRVTRGVRRVLYRQLARDINQFETLIPVPPTPSRSTQDSDSSLSFRKENSGGVFTPGRQEEGEEEDDGGWGPTPVVAPKQYFQPGPRDNGWTTFDQRTASRPTRTIVLSSIAEFPVTSTPRQIPQTRPRLGRGGAAHRFIANHLGRQPRFGRPAVPSTSAQRGTPSSLAPYGQSSTSTRAIPARPSRAGPKSTLDPQEGFNQWDSRPSSPEHNPQRRPSRPILVNPAEASQESQRTLDSPILSAQTPKNLTSRPEPGSTHRHRDPSATPLPSFPSRPSQASSSFSTPLAKPYPLRPPFKVERMSRSNLGRSPPVMRDRTQFDGVLGRIRNARSQLIEGDGGTPPSIRIAEGSSRGGHTDQGGDNRSPEIELLKKENQEYKRDISQLKVELEGLLNDMENSRSTDHEAALRRGKRQLKEKDDALKEAEAALLKASEPRSRYRSTTPPPFRGSSRNLAVPRHVEDLEDQISSLKSEVANLRSTLEIAEKRFMEECRLHKLTKSEATGAKEHQSQMAKAKNELEGQVARLEGKLDTEARSKVAAIERVRALEYGSQSLGAMSKENGVLKNRLIHAEQQTAIANEKVRDMTKKKQDIEDKCKTLRNENDALQARVKELQSQVKGEERYLKDKERHQKEMRDANLTAERLRLERTNLKQSLANARNEKQAIVRELDIRDKAMEKLQRSRERKKLPTLASEISMDPLRPSSRHISSSRDPEERTTREELPNPPLRPVSPKQSFVDRRYKLQTPLVPARSGSPEIDAAPLASVAEQPESLVISSNADHDRTGQSQATGTAKLEDSLGLTPPREASIGLNSPSPAIYIVKPSEPRRHALEGQQERSADIPLSRSSDVFDDELMVISDTIWSGSDSAMSIDGELKKRDYVEDMKALDYDPFAGIDNSFGVGRPRSEKKRSRTPPHIIHQRRERERGKVGSVGPET